MKASAVLGSGHSSLAAENERSPNAFSANFELVWGLVDHLVLGSGRCLWSLNSKETTSTTLESSRYRRLGRILCLEVPLTEFGRNFPHKSMGES